MLPKGVSGQTSACPSRSLAVAAPLVGAGSLDVKMGDAKRQLPQAGTVPKRAKSLEKEYVVVPSNGAAAASAGGLSTSPPSSGASGVPISGTVPGLGVGSKDPGLPKPAWSNEDAANAIALLRAGTGASEHVSRIKYRKSYTGWAGSTATVMPTLASSTPGIAFRISADPNGGPSTRFGNAVRIKRIVLKLHVIGASTSISTTGALAPTKPGQFLMLPKYRVIFFTDRVPELGASNWCENAVVPPLTFSTLMWSPAASATAQSNHNSQLRFNPNTFGYRFIVMHDEVFDPTEYAEHAGQSQYVAGGTQLKNFDNHHTINIDYKLMEQFYKGPLDTDDVINTPNWIIVRDTMQNEDVRNVVDYTFDWETTVDYEDVEASSSDG